ncbi:MAG: hypothetical protein ABIH46_08105 [Chloroflexota bacterium]
MHYNTTAQRGKALKARWAKAESQEAEILALFTRRSTSTFTPWQVQAFLFSGSATPITSVRRAMTDLTKAGKLRKTERMGKGPYGQPCHLWELAQEEASDLQAT